MNHDYKDIRCRINEPPKWFDENAVPRYCDWAPNKCANIYAREAALVEIACQQCRHRFMVAFTVCGMTYIRALQINPAAIPQHSTLEHAVKNRRLAYGDPPNVGCCSAGPTMSSDTVRVVQFWRKISMDWTRVPELEVRLDACFGGRTMSGLTFRENRLGEGAIEIGVRNGNTLVAVLTRPCPGAAWFLHRAGSGVGRRRFRTKQAAVAAVIAETVSVEQDE